jgi:Na+-driven multidrug efflux pump
MIKRILRIGLPSGIQQVILSMASIFVQSLINSIVVFSGAIGVAGLANSTAFVASNSAVTRVDGFANLPNQAYSMTGSTFAGQNIGAGKMERVRKGFWIIFGVSITTSAIMLIGIYIFGGNLIEMFIDMTKPDAELIVALGVHVQRIMVWCYLIMSVVQ